jgi:hypothetical protein
MPYNNTNKTLKLINVIAIYGFQLMGGRIVSIPWMEIEQGFSIVAGMIFYQMNVIT